MPMPPGLEAVPKDSGWSWAVCFGGFVINYVVQGVSKCLGVLLVEFYAEFGEQALLGSLITALVAAGFFLLAGVANAVGSFVTMRVVAVFGAILAFISMLLTAFAPSMEFIVFSLGILSGIAYGAMYGPTLVTVSMYFVKRRALANGLAVSGGSIGQLTIPLILNLLIDTYSFRYGLMIFSAILLNALPAAMMLRPVGFWAKRLPRLPPPKVDAIESRPSLDELTMSSKEGLDHPVVDVEMELPVELQDHAAAEAKAEQEAQKKGCFCSVLCSKIVDCEIAKTPLFIGLAIALACAHGGYLCSVIFIPSLAMEMWDDKQRSSLLISIMGACDLVGRLGGGAIADTGILAKNNLMGISLGIPGIVAIIMGIWPSFTTVLVYTVSLGVLAGSYTALVIPIIADYFGIAKVPSGFGMVAMVMGAVIIPLPQILGMVYNSLGSYTYVIMTCGGLLVAGSLMFFSLRGIQLIQQKRERAAGRAAGVNAVDLSSGGAAQNPGYDDPPQYGAAPFNGHVGNGMLVATSTEVSHL